MNRKAYKAFYISKLIVDFNIRKFKYLLENPWCGAVLIPSEIDHQTRINYLAKLPAELFGKNGVDYRRFKRWQRKQCKPKGESYVIKQPEPQDRYEWQKQVLGRCVFIDEMEQTVNE